MAKTIISETGITETEVEHLLNGLDRVSQKVMLGSRLKNLGYTLKYAVTHTWAGGAAMTDTHTITDANDEVLTTDVIVVNALDDATHGCVKGVRASASTITLTTGVNSANGKLYQILVYHKSVAG